MTAVPKWLLSHSNYIPRITIFPKWLLSYNYYIPRTTLLLNHNYYIPRMTTSQNSYFTIVTRYITIMTNFSLFLKKLFPRMASNYVTKITFFRNDYFPKMKTFPYLVHSQNYYFPKMTTTFPELLLSQNDHFPRRTTFPK